MTLEQILTDITAALGALGVLCSILAHLPFPAKWAERFARFATYAANAKFSVNQRDTLPKDEPKIPPRFPGALALLLVIGFALHAQACTQSKPPCDQAKLAAVVAVCTARSQQCVSEGKSEAECSSLNECDAEIEAACGAGK
jgi:hypothetical protein